MIPSLYSKWPPRNKRGKCMGHDQDLIFYWMVSGLRVTDNNLCVKKFLYGLHPSYFSINHHQIYQMYFLLFLYSRVKEIDGMPRTCTTYIFLETENRDGQDQKEIDEEAVGFSLLLQFAHGQGGEESSKTGPIATQARLKTCDQPCPISMMEKIRVLVAELVHC